MKKVFNNSFEMTYYFFNEVTDRRQWGQVSKFADAPVYRYYFWDMQDKYVRGKNILDSIFSSEYQTAKMKAMSGMIDFINHNTSYVFPCEYESVCTEADGRYSYFDVKVTPIDQISFRDMGIDYN